MGKLDFLEKKPSSVNVTITVQELSTLGNEAANCLPALSVNTIYSKLGLTTTNVGDKLNANTNCSVRISSDVNFTPNSDGKVYRGDEIGAYYFVETVFNAVNFVDGIVYAYTKGNISNGNDPSPCIIIPKTFTDSESSAVFEKGVYLGVGITSGSQTYYTKFEQKMIGTSINISGKGFTSPQKPYRYASRSFDSDDIISIFYDPNMIPDTDEAKSKGFNAICTPGDWNTKADIKLNKDLADISKAGYIGCLNVYIHNDMPFVVEDYPVVYRPFIAISYENINSIGGLCIREINNGNITVIYFNPSIPVEEYDKWANEYLSLEP